MQIDIPYALFVGIDIGSEELMSCSREASAALEANSTLQADQRESASAVAYPQSKSGYQKLERALRKQARQRGISEKEILITMEATGNFWLPPASYLYRAGFDIMVINPSSARHYAGMKLQRSKSDPIDAKVLASLGLVYVIDDHLEIRLWHEPPPIYDELRQRINLFNQMSKMVTQTSNRQRARAWRSVQVDQVKRRESEIVSYLRDHKAAVEQEIKRLLFSHSAWRRNVEILMSIPGFGPLVTGQMLVITQNFTLFDTHQQLQSYCGLAPREFSSGKLRKHKRIGHTGNARMRSLLYLAAQTAAYRDPRLRAFKQRLTQEDPDQKRLERTIRPNRGKASKVAHIAVARKLVQIAWACVHNDTLYDVDYEAKALLNRSRLPSHPSATV